MKHDDRWKKFEGNKRRQRDIGKEETTWRTNVVTDKREEKQTGERRKGEGETR